MSDLRGEADTEAISCKAERRPAALLRPGDFDPHLISLVTFLPKERRDKLQKDDAHFLNHTLCSFPTLDLC